MNGLFDSIWEWWFINSRYNEDFHLILILAGVYVLLCLLNAKVFFYQRTVRKLARRFGFNEGSWGWVPYPPSYVAIYYASYARYVALVWLCVVNWKVAVCLYLVRAVALTIWPEQNDVRNLERIKKCLQGTDAGVVIYPLAVVFSMELSHKVR